MDTVLRQNNARNNINKQIFKRKSAIIKMSNGSLVLLITDKLVYVLKIGIFGGTKLELFPWMMRTSRCMTVSQHLCSLQISFDYTVSVDRLSVLL